MLAGREPPEDTTGRHGGVSADQQVSSAGLAYGAPRRASTIREQQVEQQITTVQGRQVHVPMHIAEAVGGIGVFTADGARLAAALPQGLVPVRLPGGRGVVVLMMVDYRDNPLGDYDEGVVGFLARPAGGVRSRLRPGLWIAHMPVSQPFTREAGEVLWGYPKTVDELSLTTGGGRAMLRWERDGKRILRLAVRTGGGVRIPRVVLSTFTVKDGRLHRTTLTASAARARVGAWGARAEPGDHPVGWDLAALGLRRRALASLWVEGVSMDFGIARPLG
jgi:hypothetical protein